MDLSKVKIKGVSLLNRKRIRVKVDLIKTIQSQDQPMLKKKIIFQLGELDIKTAISLTKLSDSFQMNINNSFKYNDNNELYIAFPNLKKMLKKSNEEFGGRIRANYKYKYIHQKQSDVNITEKDYSKLNDEIYINDVIANFCFKLIEDKYSSNGINDILSLKSFFYNFLQKEENCRLNTPLYNFDRTNFQKTKLNIFNFKIVLVPICEKMHWSFIVIRNPKNMKNIFLRAKRKKGIFTLNQTFISILENNQIDNREIKNNKMNVCIKEIKEEIKNNSKMLGSKDNENKILTFRNNIMDIDEEKNDQNINKKEINDKNICDKKNLTEKQMVNNQIAIKDTGKKINTNNLNEKSDNLIKNNNVNEINNNFINEEFKEKLDIYFKNKAYNVNLLNNFFLFQKCKNGEYKNNNYVNIIENVETNKNEELNKKEEILKNNESINNKIPNKEILIVQNVNNENPNSFLNTLNISKENQNNEKENISNRNLNIKIIKRYITIEIKNEISIQLLSKENLDYPEIYYLDSINQDNPKAIILIKKFLFYEYNLIYSEETKNLNIIDCILNYHYLINNYVPKVPKQVNSYDCGIYMIIFAEMVLFNQEMFFTNGKKYIHKQNYNFNPYIFENKQRITNADVSYWFFHKIIENKRKDFQKLIDNIKINQDKAINDFFNNEKKIFEEMIHERNMLVVDSWTKERDDGKNFVDENRFINHIINNNI